MPRYIDADALLKKQTTISVTYHCQGADEWDDYEVVLVKDINNAPTISPDEVRGVVYCKECKWCHAGYCEKYDDLIPWGCANKPWEDWFCADGVKMEVSEDG